MAGSSLIGNLAVTLGLNTAAFSKGATQAELRAKTLQGRMAGVGKGISGIGASLGIGLGIGAIATLTGNAFEMAAALNESAQKMGVTVEALQELRVAAQQTGVSEDQLATAMGRLNKSMGELAQGKSAAVAAFAAIGLAAEDLKGKTPEQALRIIADQLNKLPTVQERVAAGSAIMGRSFSQLLPLINGGSKALDDYARESREAGQISTEDAKRLDELSDSWDRLKTRVGVATANIIAGADRMVTSFWAMRDKATGPLDDLVIKFWALRDKAIAAVGAMVTGVGQWITGKLNAIWEGAKAKIESVKNKFKDMYDAVVGNSYVPDMIAGIAQSMSELGKVLVDPAVNATGKVGAVFQNLAGIIGSIFGNKAGSIVGAISNFAMALAPLFGGGGGSFGFNPTGGALGMAGGGSGVFGGRAGVDRNLLSLNGSPIARVSKGEHFSVSPANQNMARVQIIPSPLFDVVVQGQARVVAVPLAGQAALAGAAGAGLHAANAARRRIP